MDTFELPAPVARVWMAELTAVATADGPLMEEERTLLAAIAEHVGFSETTWPADVSDSQLKASCTDAVHARRLLQLAIVVALADRRIATEAVAELHRIRRVTGADESAMALLSPLRDGHLFRVGFGMRMRMVRPVVFRMVERQGMGYTLATSAIMLRRMLGKQPFNASLSSRYERLGLLPEGTLGRTAWAFIRQADLHFPGEPLGLIEETVYHDFSHVLGDYDTTPLGEQLHSCFIAGYHRADHFGPFLAALLQYNYGVEITPISSVTKGIFDSRRMFEAARRGASCTSDISADFDPDVWRLMREPLDRARSTLNILPRADRTAGMEILRA